MRINASLLALAATMLVGSNLTADTAAGIATPQQQQQRQQQNGAKPRWIPGILWFKEVQQEYNAGKYKNFLEQINTIYNEEATQQAVKRMIEEIAAGSKEQTDKMTTLMQDLEKQVQAITDERNKKLKAVCQSHEKEAICSLVANIVDEDEKKKAKTNSTAKLTSDIFVLQKNANPASSQLQNIVIESIVKRDIADALAMQGLPGFGGSDDDRTKQQLALQIEQNDKLKKWAEKYPDHPLAKQIVESNDLAGTAASSHNTGYLRALASGEDKPQNATEEAVAQVYRDYLQQIRDLSNKTFQLSEQ